MAKPPGKTYKYYTGPNALWPFGAGLSLTDFQMNCSHSSVGHGGNHSFSCVVHEIDSFLTDCL